MSSYLKTLTNPKTGKRQKAFCIDDYFGPHQYGYGFPKNGEDATFNDEKGPFKNCDWYRLEKLNN